MSSSVTVVTLDQERTLIYYVEDVMEAERVLGKPVRQAWTDAGVTDLTVLLWAGLRHQDRTKITLQTVTGWLNRMKEGPQAVYSLWAPVSEGLFASGILPRPEGAAVGDPLAPGRIPSTTDGSSSGSEMPRDGRLVRSA